MKTPYGVAVWRQIWEEFNKYVVMRVGNGVNQTLGR